MAPVVPGLGELEEIGRGGFGVVYRADDLAHGRAVAVKVLRGLDEGGQARFERECRAAGSLSGHPNIVSIHHSGRTADGEAYLVMDLLSGGSLAERVGRDGPLPVADAVALGVALAGALDAAHQRGIVHRDVKPQNVLYSAFDEPQLVDFGIARMAGEFETRSGSVSASIAHAPPEALERDVVDPSADIYSLGSVLYFALCGHAPFVVPGETSLAPLLTRITTAPPPDLREHGVPDALAREIERALAKDPADRHASAAELRDALRALAATGPAGPAAALRGTAPEPHADATVKTGRPAAAAVDATPRHPTPLLEDATPDPPQGGRRRLAAAATGLFLLVCTAGLAAIVNRPRHTGVSAAAANPTTTAAANPTHDDPPLTQSGVRIARHYGFSTDHRAVSSSVTLVNTTSKTVKRVWAEVVPKQLAASTADVTFEPRPKGTIDADPIVYWVVTLKPGARWSVTWSTALPKGASPTQAYLDTVVKLHRTAVGASAKKVSAATKRLATSTGATSVDPTKTVGGKDDPVGSPTTVGPTLGPSVAVTTTPTTPAPATTAGPTTTSPATVPGIPTNVVVSNPVGTGSSLTVTLTWTAPAANGAPITGYRIRRQTFKVPYDPNSGCVGTSFTAFGAATELPVGAATTAYPLTEHATEPACSYVRWQVAAVNRVGTGGYQDARGVVPATVGADNAYHLVRAVGGWAVGVSPMDCGRPSGAGCATSPPAGSAISPGAQVRVSLQS